MDDVACIVTECHCRRQSQQRRHLSCFTQSSGQARRSRHVAGDPSKCLVRARCAEEGLQTGVPGVGVGESSCGVIRPLEGGSMQLSSPEHHWGGGFIRLSLVLCHSESCFWDMLSLLAVPSLCYCHDNWFHVSDSLNSGM